MDAGFFLGGEGIEVAAHVVEAAQDVVGLSVLGAFEDGVLHEMGEAILMRQLITRASFHHQGEVGDFALFFFMYQPNAIR